MGKQSKTAPKSPKSGRVFNIVQYENSPITGQSFNFSEANILSCVAHKSITRYAYAKHDSDHYSEVDCEEFWEKYKIQKTINDLKPIHWHIVLEAPNKLTVARVAKWLGVPENQVEVPNDRGKTPIHSKGAERVFLECVGYLTHADIRQQALDKTVYPESIVKANFDWVTEVKAAELIRTKYGKELTEKEWYRNEVLTNGLRPKDMARNPALTTAYTNDFMMLDKLRKKYLSMFAPMPATRFNYYIYSDEGRVGKGILSRAFARSLYPNIEDDEDLFFSVGGKNVSFDGYDGQPVIIWNDIRPGQLVKIFGDRGNLLDSLDMHPVRKEEHIKFGKICLTNTVNIFNSVIPYQEFFDGLAGEYRDEQGNLVRSELSQKEQVYGRFPMVIPVSVDDFSLLLNKGIMGKGAFTEFFEHRRVVSHLQKIHKTLSNREALVRKLDAQAVVPLIEAHAEIEGLTGKPTVYDDLTDEEILAQFSDVGTSSPGLLHESDKPAETFLEDELHKTLDDKYHAYLDTFQEWITVDTEVMNRDGFPLDISGVYTGEMSPADWVNALLRNDARALHEVKWFYPSKKVAFYSYHWPDGHVTFDDENGQTFLTI